MLPHSGVGPRHSTIQYYKSVLRSEALSKRNNISRALTPLDSSTYNKLFQRFYDSILIPLYPTSLRYQHSYTRHQHNYHVSLKPVVAGYYPIGSEFDVVPLLSKFYSNNHRVALPVVCEENAAGTEESPLVFWEWVPGSKTAQGKFNIPIPIRGETHPIRPDILLIPTVSFDTKGRRLGYGGGFYDRTIAKLRKYNRAYSLPGLQNSDTLSSFLSVPEFPLLICGIGFDDQCQEDLCQVEEPHDAKLDLILTEKNIYVCNKDLKKLITKQNEECDNNQQTSEEN